MEKKKKDGREIRVLALYEKKKKKKKKKKDKGEKVH